MIRAETKESQKAAPAIDPGSVAGSFLAGRTFKKRLVGGVDEVDLLGALEEMAALYEARMGEADQRARSEARRAAEAAQRMTAASERAAAAERRAEEAERRRAEAEAQVASAQHRADASDERAAEARALAVSLEDQLALERGRSVSLDRALARELDRAAVLDQQEQEIADLLLAAQVARDELLEEARASGRKMERRADERARLMLAHAHADARSIKEDARAEAAETLAAAQCEVEYREQEAALRLAEAQERLQVAADLESALEDELARVRAEARGHLERAVRRLVDGMDAIDSAPAFPFTKKAPQRCGALMEGTARPIELQALPQERAH